MNEVQRAVGLAMMPPAGTLDGRETQILVRVGDRVWDVTGILDEVSIDVEANVDAMIADPDAEYVVDRDTITIKLKRPQAVMRQLPRG